MVRVRQPDAHYINSVVTPHALTGEAHATVTRHVLALRLKAGRVIEPHRMGYHMSAVEAWVFRKWQRESEKGSTIHVADLKNMRIGQAMDKDTGTTVVVAVYDVSSGWDPAYACYVGVASEPDDMRDPLLTALQQMRERAAQSAGLMPFDGTVN